MKRTKQWWARLTKKERSELHHLEYAASNWLNRYNKELTKCNHCGKSLRHQPHRICSECKVKLFKLIQKANEATYFAGVLETNLK